MNQNYFNPTDDAIPKTELPVQSEPADIYLMHASFL